MQIGFIRLLPARWPSPADVAADLNIKGPIIFQDDASRLAELLCARLCHDLAGAVGAVGAGAELLADEGGVDGLMSDALALMAASAASAGTRLRFLRVALGTATGGGRQSELRDLAADFLATAATADRAFHLDWPDEEPWLWEAGQVKLLLNLILIAQDCLPRGGVVSIRAGTRDGLVAKVVAEGVGAAPAEAADGLRAADISSFGPRGAQGFYTARLAARSGMTVRLNQGVDKVGFSAERQDAGRI